MARKMRTSRLGALEQQGRADEEAAPAYAPEDTLSYIRDMVGELRDMAEEADQVLLAYLLDMAHEEAQLQSRRMGGRESQAVDRAQAS